MQSLLDNIAKYKKYIGAAAVLIVFIAVLVMTNGASKNKKEVADDTQNSNATEITEVSVEDFEFDTEFEENSNEAVNELFGKYYSAYAGNDEDALKALATPMTDEELSYISVLSKYYKEITDIKTYTKKGLTEGSYFVSVSYKIKFDKIKKEAPALDFFYVETDKKGDLYINNTYSLYNLGVGGETLDTDIYALIQQYMQQEDFISLQEKVQAEYDKAVKKDEDLAKMMQVTLQKAILEWSDENKKAAAEKKDDAKEEETTKEETTEKDDTEEEICSGSGRKRPEGNRKRETGKLGEHDCGRAYGSL